MWSTQPRPFSCTSGVWMKDIALVTLALAPWTRWSSASDGCQWKAGGVVAGLRLDDAELETDPGQGFREARH